jgi:hypothetical protein
MNTRSTKDESFKKVCSCVIILSHNKRYFKGRKYFIFEVVLPCRSQKKEQIERMGRIKQK